MWSLVPERCRGAACAVLAFGLLPLAAQQAVADVVRNFAPCDVDGDGVPEVVRCEVLDEAGAATAKAVLVLVEARLLQDPGVPAASIEALRERLRRHAADLAAEGLRATVVATTLHTGPPHQDGRTLLGVRRLLRACRERAPLAGAVLVGHFPDALLVRTCNWRRQEKLDLPGPDGANVSIPESLTNVRCVPEYVAHRCDTVLADLDGGWESVYVPGPAVLPSVTAVFGDPVPDAGGPCLAKQQGELHVVDVFHVRDGTAIVDAASFSVALDPDDRDHECTAGDRTLGNPLAQLEIAVSRIDARGVARLPEARALDEQGRPRAVDLAADEQAKGIRWHADPAFELQLLVDYFDRNHTFRTQPLPDAQRKPASISWGLGAGLASLRAADPGWQQFAESGYDENEHSSLVALVQWLQRPAVLRTLRAHSDGRFAQFERTDAKELAAALGGPAWNWRREGQQLVPSLADHQNGHADWFFYRTLWQNHVLPDYPYLLLHMGCEAISPPGAVELPYDDAKYGACQHAESMLFFTPCLALLGRAKVFYDEPRGFGEVLAAGGTIGDAWRRYFAIEGAASSWGEVGGDIGRKRAYFWSVLGDWTLRLPR
ncbi:MAG TPA: hypothetical protein VFZ65_14350 [Planctomycetota bacterium]|nr:hypothetical protein [Planctomycetota bacterium]